MFHTVLVARESVISTIRSSSTDSSDETGGHDGTTNNILMQDHLNLVPIATENDYIRQNYPHSILAQPIFNRLKDESSSVSALLLAMIPWDRYLVGLLPEHVKGIYAVLRNSCNQSHTYKLDESSVRACMHGRVVVCWFLLTD